MKEGKRYLLKYLGLSSIAAIFLGIGTYNKSASGNSYEIEGEWYFRGQHCAIFKQGRILLVVNENGALATAKIVSNGVFRIFQGTGWQSGLEGNISQDGNTINWSNGTTWKRG